METLLALLLGLALATVFLLFAHSRVGGERRVLAVGLVAAALIYVALAAGRAPVIWLGVELLGVAVFAAIALLGLRHSPWWLASGWAVHPAWDLGLHLYLRGGPAFTPRWYTLACLSFDLAVAAYAAARAGATITPAPEHSRNR